MKTGYHSYRAGDGTSIRSYVAVPEGDPAPCTAIILRGVAGPDEGYTRIADRFAAAGYLSVVHNWQTRGDDPSYDVMLSDLKTTMGESPAVLLGFCKGGGYAVIAAARLADRVSAVVSFHGFAQRRGGLDTEHDIHPIDVANSVHCPVLILHGEADQMSPAEDMRALVASLSEAGCNVRSKFYPDADHGFAVTTHKGYQQAAADDSLGEAVAFLNGLFGG